MRYVTLLVAAIFALVLTGCQPPAAEEAASGVEAEEVGMSDEDMLSALTDEFGAAWGNGDAAALSAMFAANGDMFDPTGMHFSGPEAIQGRYESLFAGPYQGTSLSVTQAATQFPTAESAIVRGTYEITSGDMTVGGAYTNVAVKENGEWKLHCIRSMVPIRAPGS